MDAGQRVTNYHAIFDLAREASKSVKEFMRPHLEHARTKLGTSVSDYSLPYIIDPEVNQVLDKAMKELAYLFIYRNKDAIGEESDSYLMIDHGSTADLRPRSYKAPAGLKNQNLRRALEAAPQYMFLLDSGIMESWLGSNGRGRILMEKLSRLFVDAADEMADTKGQEETPYFLLWILLNSYSKITEVVNNIPVADETKKITAEALVVGLHLVNEFVRGQLLDARQAQLPPRSRIALCWSALLSPVFSCSNEKDTLNNCNAYDVPASILGDEASDFVKKAGSLSNFASFEQSLDKFLSSKGKIRTAAIKSYRAAFYRHAMLGVLSAGLPMDSKLFPTMEQFFLDPEKMNKTLSSGQSRKALVILTKSLAKEFKDAEILSKKLVELATLFNKYSNWRPLKALKMKKDVALKQIRMNIAADLADRLMTSYAKEMMGSFKPRSGKESDRELGEQYSSGRLYQFGSRPILKKAKAISNVGHYFIDLKDYTKRTALFKEDVMAHFIREEFYEPILRIAKSKFQGLSQLEDRGGIYLNNLLGDAVSLSGDIVGIVEITIQIRRHLEQYAELLKKRQQREDLARRAQEIKKRYTSEINVCQSKRKELLSFGEKANEKIRAIQEREEALKNDMQHELDQLTGQHLISGSFISYGASANVITFDDSLWGQQKVSICEKINESARGTSRPGSVIAPINQLLELEKKRLKLPKLELPFLVYVGNSLGLPLGPQYELALRKAFSSGKGQEAYKHYVQAAQIHVRQILSSGVRGIKGYLKKGMAIYNAGDALSGEALMAYRKACARNFKFVDLNFPAKALEVEIRKNYAFFDTTLRLVVAINANGEIRQIFHYAGAVTFKGFESALPTEIWEILDMNSRFGQMMGMSQQLMGAVRQVGAGVAKANN